MISWLQPWQRSPGAVGPVCCNAASVNLLNLKEASKAFGDRVILDSVTAGVDAGDTIGLIGENGAGKSTLLKIIAGLEELDQGDLIIRTELNVAYVAQEPELRAGATAREILTEPLADVIDAIARYERLAAACDPEADGALETIEALGGWEWEHRLERAALTTGVAELDAPVARLSGGERKRLALARMLLGKERADAQRRPTLVLLDEPTNHLDAATVEWLERWVAEQALAAIVVTHDRYFLDAAANRMLEVREGGLRAYQGGFTAYLEARAAQEEQSARTRRRRLGVLKSELEWAKRSPKARTSKSKARLAGVDALASEVKELQQRQDQAKFKFGNSPRLGKTILEMQGVSKRFSEDLPLIDGFNLILRRGDRIGIVGPNGSGKSTLLRLIAGLEEPDSGTVRLGANTKLAYFDQHRSVLDDHATVRDIVSPEGGDYVFVGGTEKLHVATWLDTFAFRRDVHRMPVGRLSGGERNRLAIARFLLEPANVLLLDEPTNDLDIYTLATLEQALVGFPGCVLAVSHDRYFLDKVATAVLAFERDLTERLAEITLVEGDYTTYRRLRLAELEQRAEARANQRRAAGSASRQAGERRGTAVSPTGEPGKKLTWTENNEFEGLEPKIEVLELAIDQLETAVGAAEVWMGDGAEGRALTDALDLKRAELEALMGRWEELAERAEL